MERSFIPMSRQDFIVSAARYTWKQSKTEVHVHHTWRPDHKQYRGEPSIVGMWRYHTVEKGWSDIAQHVSIAPDGTIWSGRNWNAVPVSAAGYNHPGVFMFETIGDFDEGKDRLQGEQLDSVLTVTAAIQILFGLPLIPSIRFHNQMSRKTCPGSALDRSFFIRAVAAKRAEIEPGMVALATSPSAISANANAFLKKAAPSTEEASQIEVSAEHSHDPALEAYFAQLSAEGNQTQPIPDLQSFSAPSEPNVGGHKNLVKLDELYEELGRLAELNALGNLGTPGAQAMGFQEHFAALGRRVFDRIQRELHALVCGHSQQDKEEREKVRAAFGIGGDAVTAALVGVMSTELGIAPALAAVVAAIITRRLLAPSYFEACEFWSEQLASSSPGTPGGPQ